MKKIRAEHWRLLNQFRVKAKESIFLKSNRRTVS